MVIRPSVLLVVGMLSAAGALFVPLAANAQAAPAPIPSPSATPVPKMTLYRKGPQFISIGAAIAPRAQSEFRPGSATGPASFEGWQTGESTLLGRFHVIGYTDYRSDSYMHLGSEGVTTIGGGGTATVRSFNVHDDELESGGGPEIAPHVFAGAGFFKRQENSGYPAIKGVGYLVMLAPNPRPLISPYGWVFYEPNAGGMYALPGGAHTALTYRGTRYRAGVLIAEPGTRLALDIGVAGENLHDRTNAPMTVKTMTVTTGLAIHF